MSMPSILVVEDDELARRAFERILSTEYEVCGVGTGDEALTRVRGQRFAAVVSDIDVPGLTGIELLKAVREHDADLPVVLVTGCPSVESARDAVNFGAFSYLTKPVEPAALRAAVARASRMRSSVPSPTVNAEAERQSDNARLDRALATLWVAFQPIVSINNKRVFAYEALMRNEERSLMSPPDVLGMAEKLGRLDDVGRTTRARIAEAVPRAPADVQIFINLHAHDLFDETLFSTDAPLAFAAKRIVLEVTERASLEEVKDLPDRIGRLRAQGYRVAIDDLGAGYAGLTSVSALEPDVVKLDMSLVRDVDKSRTKQQLVSSFCRLCADLKMEIICEGVETAGERDTLIGLGGDMFQGYFFGRPQRTFEGVAL